MKPAMTLSPAGIALVVFISLMALLPQLGVSQEIYCAGCGEIITSEYISALDKCWHPEHFVCGGCGELFSGNRFYEKDGRPYCRTCYENDFLPRCCICNQPIRSAYVENGWGDVYCEGHDREFQPCYSCGRLVCGSLTAGGVTYEDGRTLCSQCRQTAVDRVDEGDVVLEDVRRTLGYVGLDFQDGDIPLRLVDRNELKQGRARDLSGHISTAEWTRGDKVIDRKIESISILYGLPHDHFASVAAHELGHAWLFIHDYPELPLHVEEGLCELLAYLWLQQSGTPMAQYRMRVMESNTDPVYGSGFQLALQSYQRAPLDKLLGYIERHKKFPVED